MTRSCGLLRSLFVVSILLASFCFFRIRLVRESLLGVDFKKGHDRTAEQTLVFKAHRTMSGPTPDSLRIRENGRLVSTGKHKLYINCSGPNSQPTVILEAGSGSNSTNLANVQGQIEKFARVCSYDRAGLGKSDKTTGQQSEQDSVEDLHQLLLTSHEACPYVLVGHSLGGVYVRAFQRHYPQIVKGLVFVDSSHEEQLNRYTALSFDLGRQFASQEGRYTYDDMYRIFGQLRPGNALRWQVNVPIVVIEHKRPHSKIAAPSSRPSNALPPVDEIWHEMQVDLSRRSTCGELWEAPEEGHEIPDEQPELVARAVSQVLEEIKSGCQTSSANAQQ